MDWTQLWQPTVGLVGIITGGIIAKRKPKADAHSVVVADATKIAKDVSDRLDNALRRIDRLEERENKRDDLARQHLRWDWKQVRTLQDLGYQVEDPPRLFLYDDELKAGTDEHQR